MGGENGGDGPPSKTRYKFSSKSNVHISILLIDYIILFAFHFAGAMRCFIYLFFESIKKNREKNARRRTGHDVITHISCLLIPQMRRPPLLPRSRTERPLDLRHASHVKPRANKHHQEVEAAVSPKDAIIQPLVPIEDVEPGRVFVAGGVLAEFAQTVAAVLHVAARLGDEGGGVGLACLTGRGREAGEFVGGADDGAAVGGDGEEAFEEIAERG